ncbi:dTDP-glucose 4,6-dehydratase [Candidatus Gottesmanbacteria bacterium RIFCSPLOWO2_01_FULL_48_11]|uniref:dTDP-glucose 4,6-dehydratase n=2 Tax=Candidatus Gottesmaniibacteriota TaxID=1752720 RepID=A0A0G1WYH6_9BACT|nr:MAG: dTDP-glucose 4,6-dehydratase [Candidatus Gottesmanbacteria bacterium GW2011_GWA2_47_9]OGG27743.1 MAG: dTDP-glucose 4,6-dehydratase [Candidatus Gottesmanbacteria bacterium RIFCSPLOWO2_01_FULL_48_11]
MKLLVTGGAGFIGSNFILYWMEHHSEDFVVNLDALTYAGNVENLKSVADNSHYQFIHGNICDASTVAEALRGVDTVVHFAAESHVDRSISEPSPFVMTNVVGTHVLLEAALKAKVKHFHHVSTDEVYGSLKLDDPSKFNERTKYNPRSPYSASKAGSDHLVNAYYHTYGLPITITNCSNNFGPFHFPEKFIPLAITNILEGKTVPVYGDGKYVRDWLYVEDHCRAIEMVIQKGKLGETYCVGGLTQDIDNLSVVKKILHIMGSNESVIEFVKDRPGHDRKYAIDWTKIKQELGWEPKHDFDTCLAKTVSWYKEHESWWRPLKTT